MNIILLILYSYIVSGTGDLEGGRKIVKINFVSANLLQAIQMEVNIYNY